MRRPILLAIALTAAQTIPAMAQETRPLAAKHRLVNPPSFSECYQLGWDRGVHVEMSATRDELEDWMDECTAGAIPFGNAASFHASSRRSTRPID